MKVTYVVPRYGLEVIGGAEYGARMLAEHLVAAGVDVEVCTTCAVDARTWENSYPPGTCEVNGVVVRRFLSPRPRHPQFDELSATVLRLPAATPADVEQRWLEMQGPVCPDVLDAADASGGDAIIFYPYLYWPTVMGALRFGPRAVLHPATHDEAPIRLPIFEKVFGSVGALVFQTAAERRMTERFFPAVSALPQAVIGLGVTEAAGDEGTARGAIGVGDRPYLLCLGRVDAGKGALMLADFFAAYKRRRPGRLTLVFMGPVVDRPAPHPDVIITGPVDEAVKWGALRGTAVLVSPSPMESFSLALLEGWTAGRPAMVNAACEATSGHVRTSAGGLAFDSYGSFEVAVDRLLGSPELRSALGEAGRAYTAGRFTWPRLTQRYRSFLESLVAGRDRRRPGPAVGPQ